MTLTKCSAKVQIKSNLSVQFFCLENQVSYQRKNQAGLTWPTFTKAMLHFILLSIYLEPLIILSFRFHHLICMEPEVWKDKRFWVIFYSPELAQILLWLEHILYLCLTSSLKIFLLGLVLIIWPFFRVLRWKGACEYTAQVH